jgi:hypothetical protein
MRADRKLMPPGLYERPVEAQPAPNRRAAPATSEGAVRAFRPILRATAPQRAPEPAVRSDDSPAREPDPRFARASRLGTAPATPSRIAAGKPADPSGAGSTLPAWAKGLAPPPGLSGGAVRSSFTAPPSVVSGAAEPPGRGLSVGEAAAVSKIAFRPISDKAIRPRFRSGYQPLERDAGSRGEGLPEPPEAAPHAPIVPARPKPRLTLRAVLESGRQPDVQVEPAPSEPAPSEPALSEPAPEEPANSPAVSANEPEASAPRFSRTVAELERRQTEEQASEPWGQMILRPATPRGDGGEAHHDDDEESVRGLRALWRRISGAEGSLRPECMRAEA